MQQVFVFLILACVSSPGTPKSVDVDTDDDVLTGLEKKTLELETQIAGLKTEICALEMKMKEERDSNQNQLKGVSANVSDTMKVVGDHTAALATLRLDIDSLIQSVNSPPPTPAPTDVSVCPGDDWVEHNGHCILFSSESVTWNTAKVRCMYYGAHLMVVDTEELNTFLKIRLRAPDGNSHYVGGIDFGQANWIWDSTNTEIGYTDWRISQPSNGRTEHCLVVCSGSTCQWNDVDCYGNKKYICQKAAVHG
ncbi:type-2 ice-structuring protein-like [Pecten maximus]|uniref:type-2 ice-structuring protein-like n=1 Tax=Pecten maximus TaxID=6579 RepID=UPI001457FCD8|nr:type-2 ice-structuring protein-like [Pecten maximus]